MPLLVGRGQQQEQKEQREKLHSLSHHVLVRTQKASPFLPQYSVVYSIIYCILCVQQYREQYCCVLYIYCTTLQYIVFSIVRYYFTVCTVSIVQYVLLYRVRTVLYTHSTLSAVLQKLVTHTQQTAAPKAQQRKRGQIMTDSNIFLANLPAIFSFVKKC